MIEYIYLCYVQMVAPIAFHFFPRILSLEVLLRRDSSNFSYCSLRTIVQFLRKPYLSAFQAVLRQLQFLCESAWYLSHVNSFLPNQSLLLTEFCSCRGISMLFPCSIYVAFLLYVISCSLIRFHFGTVADASIISARYHGYHLFKLP